MRYIFKNVISPIKITHVKHRYFPEHENPSFRETKWFPSKETPRDNTQAQ